MKKMALLLFYFCFVGFQYPITASAQLVKILSHQHPEWSESYSPFRIVGNLYYIGTADLSCFLLTTSQGHILINTGLANSLPIIERNIKRLGFNIADVRILLTNQAHFDHLGAMAAIQKKTGAVMMADAMDVPVIKDGGISDYEFGGHEELFTPIRVDRSLHDHDTIRLGEMTVTMLYHPGHTRGSCSFVFDVKDSLNSYRVLIANMPTIVASKSFSSISSYPTIATDYAYTLDALANISFDIWLSAHSSQWQMIKKHPSHHRYDPAAFIDPLGYAAYLKTLRDQYEKKLKE